jgi:hypothetical protein
MSRPHFSSFVLLGGLGLAIGCAGVLGIEDAECDPDFSPECRGGVPTNTNGGTGAVANNPMSVNPLNGGSGGAPSAAGAAGAGGSVASAGMGGAGNVSSAAGAGGTSMATAGAAGSMAINPIVANASPLCREYCDAVFAGCPLVNTQYASPEVCLAVCALLPPGTAAAPGAAPPTGNSVQCRLAQAQLAARTGERNGYCAAAGPGGANVCGTNCEGYCTVMLRTCPDVFATLNECTGACDRVPDLSDPPTLLSYDTSMQTGNTVQCRLFHVNASTQDAAMHCPHASGQMPCN